MQVKHVDHDTDADLRRLLDEGYEVAFTRVRPGYSMGDIAGYLVNLTGPFGTRSRGMGETSGEALRSVWPLDDREPADDEDQADEPEPYCTVCGESIGIFLGYGHDWRHWRPANDGHAELIAAGHVPVVGWRPAGAR